MYVLVLMYLIIIEHYTTNEMSRVTSKNVPIGTLRIGIPTEHFLPPSGRIIVNSIFLLF